MLFSSSHRWWFAGVAVLLADPSNIRAAELLLPGEPLPIAGAHGRFDFLTIDAEGRRLLAAHTGNASLDVIDLDKRVVVKVVPTGAAQSSALSPKTKSYFVS